MENAFIRWKFVNSGVVDPVAVAIVDPVAVAIVDPVAVAIVDPVAVAIVDPVAVASKPVGLVSAVVDRLDTMLLLFDLDLDIDLDLDGIFVGVSGCCSILFRRLYHKNLVVFEL
jgi:hypothetical protein